MNKQEAKEIILDMMEFLDNGECEFDGIVYRGHPGFYHFHSKEEMLVKLNEYLHKETYDNYDIYYIANKLIKFLLSKYDSHTKVNFINYSMMPMQLKLVDSKIFIEKMSEKLENLIGGEIISLNGVKADTLMNEIEEITCYSTKEYLFTDIEQSIITPSILKSLPSIDNNTETFDYEIEINGLIKHLNFNEKDLFGYKFNPQKQNYKYKIFEDVMVLTYSQCKDFEKMKEFINIISKVAEDKIISKFVVDIRDNYGGNSSVIYPLLNFLEGKELVTLENEKTFSSASMAFVDLENMGSHSIGTCISTSLNCFGNNTIRKTYENLGLTISASSKYFYYDKNLECISLTGKEEFEKFICGREELLEPFILYPDEIVNITVNDLKNGTDSQLEAALNYLNNKKKL